MDFNKFEKLQVYYNKLKLIEKLLKYDSIQQLAAVIGPSTTGELTPEILSGLEDIFMCYASMSDKSTDMIRMVEDMTKHGKAEDALQELLNWTINCEKLNKEYLDKFEAVLQVITNPLDKYKNNAKNIISCLDDQRVTCEIILPGVKDIVTKYGEYPSLIYLIDEHMTNLKQIAEHINSIINVINQEKLTKDDLQYVVNFCDSIQTNLNAEKNTRDDIWNEFCKYAQDEGVWNKLCDYQNNISSLNKNNQELQTITNNEINREDVEPPTIQNDSIDIDKLSLADIRGLLHTWDDELTSMVALKYREIMEKFIKENEVANNTDSGK